MIWLTYKEKMCEVCGKIFIPKCPNAKFCSYSCDYKQKRIKLLKWRKEHPNEYNLSKKKYNKNRDIKHYIMGKKVLKFITSICEVCGTSYTPIGCGQKYCSTKCYNVVDNNTHKTNRKENPEKYRELDKKQYYKNITHTRNTRNYNCKKLRNSDIKVKLITNLRSRLRTCLKQQKFRKTSSFKQYLGCEIDVLKKYIERQFVDGMNWGNYGFYGWHLDHKIPLASAKNEEEIYKLFFFKNLQPLWATDNLSKGSKYDN